MQRLRIAVVSVWLLGVMASVVPLPFVAAQQTSDPLRANVTRDPRLPGDHRAEQDYEASLRLTPPGITPAQARARGLAQANALPGTEAIPAALEGARPVVSPQIAGNAPPAGVWRQLGPSPDNSDTSNPNFDYQAGIVSGRATALVIGQHTGVIYLGTAGGGVWKSASDGASWTPLTDAMPSLSTGSLALDPTDVTDRTLYVGTGEANFSGDAYAGVGIYKTVDGGVNWTLLGASTFAPSGYGQTALRIGAMAVDGATVFAATPNGLYRSPDGGATWSLVTVTAAAVTAPITDVVIDGTSVYTVISSPLATYAYAGVYKSVTSGVTGSFISLNATLPIATNWHRAQIAIARSNTQVLYLTIASTADTLLGVYKTVDGGSTWAATSTQPPDYFSFGTPNPAGPDPVGTDAGQGWYDIYIAVDPTNEDYVYSGGISEVGSADGGATWNKIADVYCGGVPLPPPCHAPIHPDQHAGAFGITGSPRAFYAANDGGIYKTANPTAATPTWTSLNAGLSTTQLYAGDTTANYLTNPITIAGAQDNGTVRTVSANQTTWNAIRGGDGAFVGIDRANTNHVYTEYANGYFYSSTNANAGTAITWTDRAPPCRVNNGVLFINPFVVDHANGNSILYAAYGVVCKSLDGGASWVTETVGSGLYTRSLAMEPGNSNTRYAGTTTGVYRTLNGNFTGASTWAACGSGLPTTGGANRVIGLTAATGGVVYATLSGFGVHHVWRSTNCGAFTDVTGNLPDAPVTSLVQYATNGGGTALIVSTDVGVFLSTNGGTNWSHLGDGLPNTPIDQVITDDALTTLLAITHGRGVWRIDIPGNFSVTGLSPNTGTVDGGTPVQISGTGFTTGMSVTFDGLPATNVTVISGTVVRVNTPAHATGASSVQVTLGASTLTAGTYTYGTVRVQPTPHAPTATSVSPPMAQTARRVDGAPLMTLNTPLPQPVRR